MTIDSFPENVTVTVVNDATNRFHASEEGRRDLECVTEEGERIRIDLISDGSFEGELSDLLGQKLSIKYLSTREYFAHDITVE